MSNKKQDELDSILDTALAKYAASEPRPGLEDRVLANLRTQQTRTSASAWWRWSAAAALAVVIVTVALALRSGKSSPPVVANYPAVATQALNQPVTPSRGGSGILPPEPAAIPRHPKPRHRPTAIAAQPKLDQFPSPQPLSEQERILAIYVAQYPKQAVLIARARSEELRQDQLEEMKAFRSGVPASDSEEPNSNSTER
jgi:hypothetical protein